MPSFALLPLADGLAAGMRAHVPPARHPALRTFAARVLAHHQNRGRQTERAYWAQVLAHLSE